MTDPDQVDQVSGQGADHSADRSEEPPAADQPVEPAAGPDGQRGPGPDGWLPL